MTETADKDAAGRDFSPPDDAEIVSKQPSFAALLMAIPYPLDIERDTRPVRDLDLQKPPRGGL